MSKLTKSIIGITTAIWLSGVLVFVPMTASAASLTQAQINAIVSLLQSFGADQSTITSVQAALSGTPTTPVTPATGYTFSKNLTMGDTGTDVTNLQTVLKSDVSVYPEGLVTGYFGALTKAAVIKFQNKYAAEVLTPLGLTAGTGYVGAGTRAKLNALSGGVVTPGVVTPGVVTPAGTGLTLSSAIQPTATIAPGGAARLPFTKVTFTAGLDGDVVVSGVNIERTGLAVDANFAGVVLLDENGTQLGIEKTFNSDHKATVGEAFTVKAGQSRTMTIAGNMAVKATLATYAGQIAYISVTGANTSATVTGALPITGAGQTINGTLTLGSIDSPTKGAVDPGAHITKEVGATGYTFSAIRFSAGSAEKLRVKSIRWYQSGSAGAGDIANLKTYDITNGKTYDNVVSADGKYFTATFGDGIVVDKGNTIEFSIKGDVAGGSGRTIKFDIYKRTDLYVTGETYGYGVTAAVGTNACTTTTFNGLFCTANPWYNAYTVTVSNGTLTVEKANSVAAQNIAVNLSGQPLGGVTVEAKGEAITVASMKFNLMATGDQAENITNISLVDENGTVVAGPKDGVSNTTDSADGYVTFTDTVTFPIGKKTYTLKGKLGTAFVTNDTVTASTTPSSDWTTVTGQVTGNTITPAPASAISLNAMTVKSATVAISLSADPVAQTVVAGVQGHIFAKYIFDATASGEDIKFSSVPLAYTFDGTATYITGCTLYDGSTTLTTGSNIINPTATGNQTFTFDTGLTIPKGTTKTIALKCNIAGSATDTSNYTWGAPVSTAFSATGLTSGQTATITTAALVVGHQMAIGTGTLLVAADSSTPSYGVAAAGTSGVTVGVLKFTTTNEAVNLTKLGLQLTYLTTNGTASTSLGDLVQATLWDGSTQVGTATFTATTSTSTLSANFIVPKDGSKTLTIKADLGNVGTSQAGQQGALIVIDYVGAGNAQGTGQASGGTVTSTSVATAFAGVRMFRGYPTFARITTGINTTLVSGSGVDLYRFSVTANPATGNGIGVGTFVFSLATSSGSASQGTTTVTNIKLYAYTESTFSTPVAGFSNGQIANTIASIPGSYGDLLGYATTTLTAQVLQVPAGTTYYFRLLGDVAITGGTGTMAGSVTTRLLGDSAYPKLGALMASTTSTVEAGVIKNAAGGAGGDAKFIWSPNATTTSATSTVDWTNGYGIPSLPSSGLDAVTISK